VSDLADKLHDDKFTWGDDVLLSQCLLCHHAADGPDAICAAFPGQIPADILGNDVDHRKPWIDSETGQPGDTGIALHGSITFAAREGVNPITLGILYQHLDSLKQ
jgi:hypothetical protein